MREASWVALFRHIPAEQQDGLILITKSGVEITINNFLRIDHEFIAFRGRLAGSQEGGKLFMVPYVNIDYMGTLRPVKDVEFQETYGNLVMPDPAGESNDSPPAEVPAAAPRSPATIKSAVLERFRSRSTTAPQGVASRPAGEG